MEIGPGKAGQNGEGRTDRGFGQGRGKKRGAWSCRGAAEALAGQGLRQKRCASRVSGEDAHGVEARGLRKYAGTGEQAKARLEAGNAAE